MEKKHNLFFKKILIIYIIIICLIIVYLISLLSTKIYLNQFKIKSNPIENCISNPKGICENNYHHINGCCSNFTETIQINKNGSSEQLEKIIPIKINSLGFRNKEYPIEKNKNTKRIIFLGDSFVYGFGELIEDTFPILLENKLNNEKSIFNPHKYEIWNIGVVSWATNLEYLVIKDKIINYNPDQIILLFDDSDLYGNELYEKYAIYKNGELIKFENNGIPWFNERKKIIESVWINWNEEKGPNNEIFELQDKAIKYLNLIKKELSNQNIEFTVIFYPYPWINKEYENIYINEFMSKLKENQINYFNLYPYLMDEYSKNYYSPQHNHWNKKGHEYITDIFYDYIIKNTTI